MILIRGAGPVGCALALALARGRHPVSLVETGDRAAAPASASTAGSPLAPLSGSPLAPFSGSPLAIAQTIALSYASRLILDRIGAWSRLATTPIETVLVSQAGAFGRTRLEARDAGVPALGYVTDYVAVSAALREAVRDAGIATLPGDGTLREQDLTVHAEGRSEDAQARSYEQHALIATVESEPPAHRTAFERFMPEGPLALLPLAGRYGLVWSNSPERARALAAMPADEFLAALSTAVGAAAGRLRAVSARATLPLALRIRVAKAAPREVYIGNAAQALHPVAGQGLNLGLRDAWDLARTLATCDDPGAAAVLRRYTNKRRVDRAATIRATDSLARLFLGEDPALRAARGLALAALDAIPPARRFFARRMIFGANALP